MGVLRAIDIDQLVVRAASALGEGTGARVTLDAVQVLSDEQRRNVIARARVRSRNGPPRSVIVKATRDPTYDPRAAATLQNSGLVKEWVATALLAAHAPAAGHAPALLAGDLANGILVFEDLGAGLPSLVGPLLKGSAGKAERALAAYARALGRLHAETAGCGEQYDQTFLAIFGSSRPRRPAGWFVKPAADLAADRIGGAAPESELAFLASRAGDPGAWQALIHGDPCPDNVLAVGDRMRLIDYEFARPGHALMDGIYWAIGFPTCWCAGRIPPEAAARVEAAYRAELGRAVPPALDDALYRAELACVSAVWLFNSLHWRFDDALKEDTEWGIWSVRGRILWYLEAVIELTAGAGVLPGINGAAKDWLAALRRRWPDATPLGLYPAFAAKPG